MGYPPEVGECFNNPILISGGFPAYSRCFSTGLQPGRKKDDCLPIIRTSRQASGVSLSPRSGRNERSEWRTARRAVDWRGGAAPFYLWSTNVNVAVPAPGRQLSGSPG